MARQRPHKQLEALLAETRRIARRNRRRLDPHALAEIAALQVEAAHALESGDEARIARASEALADGARRHLAQLRPGLLAEAALMVAVALLLAAAVRIFAVEAYRIPSASMIPTLLPGEVVLVDKSVYGVRLPGGTRLFGGRYPARGELIVFESPIRPGELLIKRVAGLPGDVVELIDEQLVVSGVPQPRRAVADRHEYWNYQDDLDYWHLQTGNLYLEEQEGRRYATVHSRLLPRPRPDEGPFVVPPGHLFVLGDNRDDSEDSRSDGGWYVPLESVRGRAMLVAFSWGPGGSWFPGDQGVRLERLFRRIDGPVAQPDEATMEEAAARLRGELQRRGVIEPAPGPDEQGERAPAAEAFGPSRPAPASAE